MDCNVSFSFFNAVVTFLATFILTPAVLALPPLPTIEHHRRTPVLTIMAVAFSPIGIAGYSVLAIVISYSFVRLFHLLKSRLTSATRVALPQPVSAGRTSSYSLYSPLALLRSRRRAASTPTRSRWSPLSAFLRRLSRRSTSPLHLSDADHLLPTAMPDSPSAHAHSLIDLPIIFNHSSRAPTTTGETRSLSFNMPMRQLSKASSMEALTVYRPLTPVPVIVPAPIHIASPSTPPPLSPTPISVIGMSDSDFPLIPITPPKSRYIPAATSAVSGLPTPPLSGKFPAISPSPPSNPSSSTFCSGGPRAASPTTRGIHNNGLFLSSRNLSSLSLSPRSAYHMPKRSKSLGGVAVKKISPPQFNSDGIVSQGEDSQEDVEGSARDEKIRPLSAPASLATDEEAADAHKWTLRSETPSPTLLTTDSDSPPSSAPLETPRSISNASYPDIFEKKSLPPNSIPLVDINMNADTDNINKSSMMLSCEYDLNGKKNAVNGWSFDVEEPVAVGRVWEDFVDDDVAGTVVDVMKTSTVGIATKVGQGGLTEFEDAPTVPIVKGPPRENAWRWDEDIEGQEGGWDIEVEEEQDEHLFDRPQTKNERVALDNLEESGAAIEVIKLVSKPSYGIDVEAEPELEEEVEEEYPDPDLLPLPETTDIVPPAISICTQDIVLHRNESSEWDSVLSSAIERATPVSLGQTPTPPASPPREARNLPKTSKNLLDQALNVTPVFSPVAKSPAFTPMDVETQKDEVASPIIDQEEAEADDAPYSINVMSPQIVFLSEGEAEAEAFVFFDKPIVSSPASISSDLPGTDEVGEEITINIECVDEGIRTASDDDIKVQIIPASPCGNIVAWHYESEDEEELDLEVQLEQEAGTEGEGCEGELEREMQVEEILELVSRSLIGEEGQGYVENKGECSARGLETPDIQVSEEETLSDRLALTASDPEVPLDALLAPAEIASSYALQAPDEDSISSTAKVAVTSTPPATQFSTSLPGTFPDTTTSPTHATKVEVKLVEDSSASSLSQPQIRRRTRTPLEEAIARTRSPLEVALAMQLRPGLGPSADPAWMVRFMMVMWGWVFGLALAPSASV